MTARLVVLISGNGSNLQAVLDACAEGELDAEVVAVVSNVADAYGLQRASAAGARTEVLLRRPGESRAAYDTRLADLVAPYAPDFVVLAGFMRLLSMAFLARFPRAVVNLHPALPGEYPGLHAIERAHADARAGLRSQTGVMVHLVPDEGVDDGPVLATETVAIHPNDSVESLAERIHATEHALLVSTLRTLTKEMAR
jgi:formyltetrahydrofolate-dependent phosphoribosylglycinamide formyltransferase